MRPILTHILILIALATSIQSGSANSPQSLASQYPITINKPAPGFFEGALLGNGGMGVVVTTRPDAVVLHFGHNNVWDIRVTENHRDKIGTFDEIFARASTMPDTLESIHHDPWFSEYLSLTADNYRSRYPRPFPCGSVLLGFDRREVELLGHTLDIATGTCQVRLLKDSQVLLLDISVDMSTDELWMQLTDSNHQPVKSCFNRVRLIPDPSTPAEMPRHQDLSQGRHILGFMQILPRNVDCSPSDRDKAFALRLWSNTPIESGERATIMGHNVPLDPLERYITDSDTPLLIKVRLDEGAATNVADTIDGILSGSVAEYNRCIENNIQSWRDYWQASAVELGDKELERIWYRNMYFFNCAVKPGVICPGIFANWSYADIGTAWHGDYHLNYNTQQPFWLTFSSNHLDKNLAYCDLVDHLMPISRKWASEYYGMRGAFFPHSAYPVEMTMHPYPVPDWGWEVFETPWMVQGLWWHYLYSGDLDFLRQRAFVPIKAAVEFLVDYMSRPDAHGSQRWNDNLYHIFPSVPPELYGLQPGFKFNYDTQIDITLTRHIFNAYIESVGLLGLGKQEKALLADVRQILSNMPDYPVATSDIYGKTLVSVPGERDNIVYNVPANLAVVFPGNEYGLNSPDSIQALVRSTIRAHRNEGGNDIVFLNMQKARMGMLDLEAFKRQINYASLPDCTITDAVLETGGRYDDRSDFMYMAPMGIWFENFAVAAVINECLMQCYDGTIRLFPNWNTDVPARFHTLRAQGAFLISASAADGVVGDVEVMSERGGTCAMINPWNTETVSITSSGRTFRVKTDNSGIIRFDTKPGDTYIITSGTGS